MATTPPQHDHHNKHAPHLATRACMGQWLRESQVVARGIAPTVIVFVPRGAGIGSPLAWCVLTHIDESWKEGDMLLEATPACQKVQP